MKKEKIDVTKIKFNNDIKKLIELNLNNGGNPVELFEVLSFQKMQLENIIIKSQDELTLNKFLGNKKGLMNLIGNLGDIDV